MSQVNAPQPRLPFEPLRQVVERRLRAAGLGPDNLSALGWTHNSRRQKAYRDARITGDIPLTTADLFACELGMHPCQVWGEDWWNVQVDPAAGCSPFTAYDRLRALDVAFGDMPEWVQEGMRERWRAAHKRASERRKTA